MIRAALGLLVASACAPPPVPRPLPFDPLPPNVAALAAQPGPVAPGTETAARWRPPFTPRVVGEFRVDGGVRAPVVLLQRSCPDRRPDDCACTDDLVLVASTAGTLTAFDPAGSAVWHFRCGAPVTQAPIFVPATGLFARCDDGTIAALDPTDGAVRWRLARPARLVAGLGWSSSAGLLLTADRGMAALHPAGATAWVEPEPGPFLGAPVAVGNVALFAGLDRRLHGLDAATGEPRWRRWVVGGVESGPLVLRDGGVVVATLYGRVYAFTATDGTLRWETVVGELVRGRPAEGTDGTILVPVIDGAVVGLDPGTGGLLWGHSIPAEVLAEPLPVVGMGTERDEGQVVVGDRDGFLYAIRYPPRGGPGAGPPTELWRYNVGLPLEARPTLQGAALLVGLEDGRVVRVLPGVADCGAAAEEAGAR